MVFQSTEIRDKRGQIVILRNAEESDAEDLIQYLRVVSAETPFLVREPEEITLTVEQEREFLRGKKESESRDKQEICPSVPDRNCPLSGILQQGNRQENDRSRFGESEGSRI